MKLVQWDDDNVPPVNTLPNGDGVVADCRYWWNLEVGDQIQYHTEIGTSCYFVIDKQPATPDSGLGEGVYHVVIRTPSLIEGVIFT
jgi:hypothetical protein